MGVVVAFEVHLTPSRSAHIGVERAAMILSGVEFIVMFAVVFGVCDAVARKRAATLEAKLELNAQIARQRRLAETRSDDLWRANKRLTMR